MTKSENNNDNNNNFNLIKLSVVGGYDVGKSSITQRFISGEFIDTSCFDSDIDEESNQKQCTMDNDSFIFDILDTQADCKYEYDSMIQCNGFILMYSITSRSSFEKIKVYKDQIDQLFSNNISNNNNNNNPNYTMIIIGNKSDSSNNKRQVSKQEGIELSNSLDLPFKEISCKNDNQSEINNIFFEIATKIKLMDNNNNNNIKGEKKRKSKSSIFKVIIGKITK